jgi:dTMP kinase
MPDPAAALDPSPDDRRLLDLIQRQEDRRGLLVAFEGADASGKTTQRKLFTRWLESVGHRTTVTKWSSSNLVKPVMKMRRKAGGLGAEESSLLEAADLRHRLEHDVLPALWDGRMVVADGYFFTALARNAARGIELDWLLHVYEPLFWPDIVFYFSVSLETSTRRLAAARTPALLAGRRLAPGREARTDPYRRFLSRIIREYEALALIFQFVTIDAEQPIHEQHHSLRRLFTFGQRRPWPDRNLVALVDWLSGRPDLRRIARGAATS